ncbi:multidrug effflux MFS transporter [Paraburkholderia phenazinium]|jgi:DHA1 family bicyclomycin/chloramphenicol resistance-like MFS transporter|uniref:Bcr/CflA family efflux transporter n=1 Tax=Paraburkholderia phenazinium TaxID=60549 RepID=A0A1G8DZ10_9BURK|nr:multidrug effflux MFS transporter [Paraburkholderia phenazinium]SDH62825.1 MFS transporter, DHA1 family, bicyclomycin/chloramphenicol resistance protein [Paraburkholderia phenazinium]
MSNFSLILVVSMLSAFGLIASDVYLPAMPDMAHEFHVGAWQMPQTVSAYLIALAVTQLFYGPLSDRWGRKPVLSFGILLYIAGSIGCAHAGGFTSFLGWRMLEALGAASGLVIGRAIIADTCDKKTSAKVYSIVYPLVSLSPALAPAVGGYLAVWFGWRADFLFVAGFGAVAFCLVQFLLKETKAATVESRGGINPFAGFFAVLMDRAFVRYTVVVCAIYCSWFVYLTQSPFIFSGLGFSETQSGWLYLPLTAGIILANVVSRRLLDRISYDGIVVIGVACFVSGGLAFVALELLHVKSVFAIVLPMFLISLSNGSSLSLAVSGAIASEHGRAASASGLVGFFQIGSASLAAATSSGLLGTGSHVLAAALPLFAFVAAFAIVPRWHAARKRLVLQRG